MTARARRSGAIALVLLLLVPLAPAVPAASLPDPFAALGVEERPPIVIRGESALLLGPLVGVRGGSGTASDPYIIDGWRIRMPTWTPLGLPLAWNAIEIRETTSHILVRGNSVLDAANGGILLQDAHNVRVEGNFVRMHAGTGVADVAAIRVLGGSNVVVKGNTILNHGAPTQAFHGVHAGWTSDLVVEDNSVALGGVNTKRVVGVGVYGATHALVQANSVTAGSFHHEAFVGVLARETLGANVRNNTVTGSGLATSTCFLFDRTTNGWLADNVARSCGEGMHLSRHALARVERNDLRGGVRGLTLEEAKGGDLVASNRIEAYARPFDVTGAALASYLHKVTPDNTVDGLPVLWVRGQQGVVVDATGAAVVFVVDSRDVAVENVDVAGQAVGLTLAGVHRGVVSGADVRGNGVGIRVLASSDTWVEDVLGGEVRVEDSHNVTVARSTLTGAAAGVRLVRTTGSTVEHVRAEGNTVGVEVEEGNGDVVRWSVLTGNVHGARLLRPAFVTIRDSDVVANSLTGVTHEGVLTGGSRSDLRENWWGHADGPSHLATLAGDRLVLTANAKSSWTPWRVAPAPGAGP